MAHCPAIDDPKSHWPQYCPNIIAAYIFAALFGLGTIAHVVQAIVHRKPYGLVIIMSSLMQTGNFVIRILSIRNVENKTLYSDWFILMMVAPVWTNAYAYMVMGRIVYNFTPSASVFKVKAWRLGVIFVLLDVVAFFIQIGGLTFVGAGNNPSKQTSGIHIYMAGIGFQLLFILLFLGLAIRLHNKISHQERTPDRKRARTLIYVELVVAILISIRIIFRLIEYSQGLDSYISLHEVYQYIFDSTLMFIAMALFNIEHPGRLMPGKDSNWPSRKERKMMKRMGQEPGGRAGQDHLMSSFNDPAPKYDQSQGEYGRLAAGSPNHAGA